MEICNSHWLLLDRKSKFEEKVASVVNLNVAAMNDLIETANDTKKAADLTREAADILYNSSKALEDNEKGTTDLGETLANFGIVLPELQNFTDVAFDHAMDLRNRVSILIRTKCMVSSNQKPI